MSRQAPVVRRSYLTLVQGFALALLVLMSGGASSPALAEGSAETVGRSGAPKAAVQQAIRRSVPWPREATPAGWRLRSEEHTSELQSLMRISYAVFCLKKKKKE